MTDRVIMPDGTAVLVRRSARARRLTLRVAGTGGGATLTVPAGLPRQKALAFLTERADWLRAALARVPEVSPVLPGVLLPVAGVPCCVTVAPVRAARLDGQALLVPAHRAGAAVEAFLKARALAELTQASARHAAALGRSYAAITLRDTRSRWGSCTQGGRLMYSWRLAMAPPEVLDYVAAHEVAHLAHMDHSPAFWGAVGRLFPGYERQRQWLRQHGSSLHAWRFREA